jgi:hypothetical protein
MHPKDDSLGRPALPVYRLGVTDWWRKIDMWMAGRVVDNPVQ